MTKFFLASILCSLCISTFAQRNCGTELYNQDILNNYPELMGRYGRTSQDQLVNEKLQRLSGTIKIPVVIHVVYNNSEENISGELINSQIRQLNLDFSAKNQDLINVPDVFKDRIADCQIEFVLSSVDRVKTNKRSFLIQLENDDRGNRVYNPTYEPIKFSSLGGKDGLPCSQYLNIWVGNITDGSKAQLLGYAAFPGGLCEYDGVVIYYKCFGTSTYSPFNKGRTLTHEIGHWLNLRHIGGDRSGGCGDDFISDTPPQRGGSSNNGNGYGQNFGCPNHPLVFNPECSETTAEMFMNYMDYVDDACMCMFTKKQKNRMRSLFIEGGDRASFLSYASINKDLIVEDTKRTDIFTPVITEFKKYFRCRPVHDTCKYAYVSWTQPSNTHEYKVYAKKVKDDTWETTNTSNNFIRISGLGSHVLYEIKVQAILSNGTYSTESTPYIFKLKGGNLFSKFRKLNLIK